MEIHDNGVLEPSFMDFSLPSNFARKALYYMDQFGHFHCDGNYLIQRESLELFLMMYICEGSLFVKTKGFDMTAEAENIVLLDCRRPRIYGCRDRCEFLWFHFNGASSAAYTEYLYDRSGILYADKRFAYLKRIFQNLFALARGSLSGNEFRISHNIDSILTTLASPEKSDAPVSPLILPALNHIHENFSKPLTIDELADLCMMSPSHLIRTFKKYLDCTPHEYLLLYRLKQSKYLLISTSNSIDSISEDCGFNSLSHYARAFKKVTGMTPSDFRALAF